MGWNFRLVRHVILMSKGRIEAVAPPQAVMTEASLTCVYYEWPIRLYHLENGCIAFSILGA
jgi:ABC-type hemin transport system ATPase subunit